MACIIGYNKVRFPFLVIQFLDYSFTTEYQNMMVFVSWGWCNKLSQTWCLRKVEIYSLTGVEARSPSSIPLGGDQGFGRPYSHRRLSGESSLCWFQPLVAANILMLETVSLQSPSQWIHCLLLPYVSNRRLCLLQGCSWLPLKVTQLIQNNFPISISLISLHLWNLYFLIR